MADATAVRTTQQQQMTYARARLWLGITCVGTFVVIAALLLTLGAPHRAFGNREAGLVTDATAWLQVLGIYLLLSLPFDLLGGYVLPRRFGRRHPTASRFAGSLLRGALVQGLVWLLGAMAILAAGRQFGLVGVAVVAGVLMAVIVAFQFQLARLVARMPTSTSIETSERSPTGLPPIRFAEPDEESFVGGFTGLPGFERLIVPGLWRQRLTNEQVELQLKRREGALRTGSRTNGLLLAFAWNLGGLLICALAPGSDVSNVAGLLTLSLWFTLWSFLGLLVLPTPSRAGVFASDAFSLDAGAPEDALTSTMEALDRLQDDEPERPRGVETIFHPVPSVQNRIRRLRVGQRTGGAYHAARMALPMSWVCLGFLGRAVHCNCGRPALWAMLPGD